MGFSVGRTRQSGQFKGSLARQWVIFILLLSLLPVLMLGTTTYFRSRQLLLSQIREQMQSVTQTQANQLKDLVSSGQLTVDKIASDSRLTGAVNKLMDVPNDRLSLDAAQLTLRDYLERSGKGDQVLFDELMIVNLNAKLLVTTNPDWGKNNYSENYVIKNLLGRNKSQAFFNPAPFYYNKLVLFSAATIKDYSGNPIATVIGSYNSTVPRSSLVAAGGFFPSATAYYLTNDNIMLGINPSEQELTPLQSMPEYQDMVLSKVDRMELMGTFNRYETYGDIDAFSYILWMPELSMGLVLEVPQRVVFSQLVNLSPLNLLILISTLLITGGLTYLFSFRIVQPLLDLVRHAHSFAEGNWSQRARVNRNDEIGLLAYSFNRMVEQITDLYRSLEQKVAERTEQIRLASEVGQLATSSAERGEIIRRTVELVVERFGYLYAGMYLLDDSGLNAVLIEESTRNSSIKGNKGVRVRLGSYSLIGWVLANSKSRVIGDIALEPSYQELMVETAQSALALPIMISDKLLGVLNVQSTAVEAFDDETVSVLQTLTNQVAASLENIRLLEGAQVNIEETALLYRCGRQVAMANNETEVLGLLNNTLNNTRYVAGIYAIEFDHINVLSIIDAQTPTGQNTATGISLPLLNVAERLTNVDHVMIDNLAKPNEFENMLTFFVRRGCRSAVVFPIREGDQLAKILILGERDGVPITETGLQPFTNLMAVTSSTLSRFRLVRRLEESYKQLQTLGAISQSISVVTDLSVIYQNMHREISQLLGSGLEFAVMIYDENAVTIQAPFVVEAGRYSSVEPFPLGEGMTSHVINTRQTLLINRDAQRRSMELGAKIIGRSARSWLGIPLLAGESVVGVIVIQDLERENRFKDEDVTLLETMAPQLAIAIRNAQLVTDMQAALRAYDQERFFLNTLLTNTPDQVYFTDQEGHYIRVSRSFTQAMGMESDVQVIGRTPAQIIESEQGMDLLRTQLEMISSGQSAKEVVEHFNPGENNESWAVVSRIVMRTSEDENVGLLSISHDITDMKRAEAVAQRNSQQIRTAAEIARDTTGTLVIDELLAKAVNLVRERFGFYHASIFLLDPTNQYAILRESTGTAGAQMKTAGHRLAVGSRSIVGRATEQKQAMVINDVTSDPAYYANPLLPDTRSELTIPMMIGDRVLGALDVQSTHVDAFTPEDISILQILADQLAVAVMNANLFANAQENLSLHRMLHTITSQAAAKGNPEEVLIATTQTLKSSLPNYRIAFFTPDESGLFLNVRASAGYEGVEMGSMVTGFGEGAVGMAAENQQSVVVTDLATDPRFSTETSDAISQIAVPVLYSGNLLGVLLMESPKVAAFDENDQDIMTTLGNSLGAILYNAQLISEIRRQVEHQRRIYDVTSRIRRSVDIQTILQTSAAEICRAVGAGKAYIELMPAVEQSHAEQPSMGGNGSQPHDEEER